MNTNYLELKDVNKSFHNFTLSNISFTLPKGYIMGLIGSNGAGKTTTIKLILNMIEKDSGNINVLGKDNLNNENYIKQNIGVVFDSNIFVDSWTISETQTIMSTFYDDWNYNIFQEMIERFKLPQKTKVRELSRGMQMKLMLACAFSHNAKLLILDEPTSGLDPVTRDELLEILQEYIQDGEKSVLFSTHIITDLEKIADYITFLNHGKLFYTGSFEDLIQQYYIVKGAPNDLTDELKNKIMGLRQTKMGFEGLIHAETALQYKGYVLNTPTIEDIMIYVCKEAR